MSLQSDLTAPTPSSEEKGPGSGEIPMVAIFGPTGVGKTEVAVAVNCDSIQVYRGLELISGAADARQQKLLEHRLISFVPVDEECSAGRYSELAHAEIDSLMSQGALPILVGGTGLYLRGALTEMKFRPPVPVEVRVAVEAEMQERGAKAVHSELPEHLRERIHPNDRSRVARAAELRAIGREPAPDHAGGGELWTAKLRRPSLLVGLVEEEGELRKRIGARVCEMASAGAGEEAKAALDAGASRTARAAIGFAEFLAGDPDLAATRHWQYARRQMTWMRRMEGVKVLERSGRDDQSLAQSVLELAMGAHNAGNSPSG